MSSNPVAPSTVSRRQPRRQPRRLATAVRKDRRARLALAILIDIVIVYVLWQGLTMLGVLPRRFFPDANEVTVRGAQLLGGSVFWAALGHTVKSWIVGLVIGGVAGTIAGVLIGSSDRAYRFCRVVIELLRPIPPIAILPIVLLVLGVTLQFKVALILQGIFWVVLLQAVYGVRGVDRVMLETGQSYGMSRFRRFFYIRLPGSLPYIVTGIRIASIFALVVSITSELVGGAPGLGNQILKAMTAGDSRTMYALILLTGLLGVFITATFTGIEKRVLFWHSSYRAKSP